MVLSTAYLPNIQYISKFLSHEPLIEAHENFQKQSYRNRAEIMTVGGVKSLVVPVSRKYGRTLPIRDIEIDYTEPWQRSHWRTLTAAYASAPFFDHYNEHLRPFFEKEYKYLWDLNCELTSELLRIFGMNDDLRFTKEYVEEVEDDFRNGIHPKIRYRKDDPDFCSPKYYQVFSENLPFVENLSVVDYLFCEGGRLFL